MTWMNALQIPVKMVDATIWLTASPVHVKVAIRELYVKVKKTLRLYSFRIYSIASYLQWKLMKQSLY